MICSISRCNTLQHAATHFNTLQHTASHFNTLQHTASHCITLQHTATRCNTLQRAATHCNTPQHTATHCNTLQTITKGVNKEEIAEVFSMTVEELLDKRGLVKENIDMGTRMPAFESGPHRVWYNF